MNEITLPDGNLPAHLQGRTSDASDLVTSQGSVPRISLRGRRFRLIKDGEEQAAPEGSPLTVVIMAATPHGKACAKTYYAEGYTPGSDEPPDCSSEDGVHPSSMVDAPVHTNCAECPMNAWGSTKTMQGKDAKACKDQKHLWVVNPNNINGVVYRLSVPPASLRALSDYGRALAARNVPIDAIISKISFADSEFPQLVFAFDGFLSQEKFEEVTERGAQGDIAQLTHQAPVAAQPAEPPPPVDKESRMTDMATHSYEEYIKAGWSETQLVNHGLMEEK